MRLVNMNWLGMLGKKLAGVKVGKLWKKVKVFLGATHGEGEVGEGFGEGLCDIFLTELNPGYEVGEYELARCVG